VSLALNLMGPAERFLTTLDIEGKHKHRYPISLPDKERFTTSRGCDGGEETGQLTDRLTRALQKCIASGFLQNKCEAEDKLALGIALANGFSSGGARLRRFNESALFQLRTTYAGKYCDAYFDVALLSSEEYNRTLCGTAASAWATCHL